MSMFDRIAAYIGIGIVASPVAEKYLSSGPATWFVAQLGIFLIGVAFVNGASSLIEAIRDRS